MRRDRFGRQDPRACGATPEPQVIEKIVTQVVEKTIVETVMVQGTPEIVEKVVTQVVEVEVEKQVTAVPEVITFDQAPDPTTLTLVDNADIAMLDPHLAYEGSSYAAINNIIEGLVFYNRESASEFVPWLAEEVPTVQNGGLSEDGLTYTFKIRDGIKFANGNDLTPEDVAYSWERALLQSGPNSGQWMMIESIMGWSSGDITEPIAEGEYAGDRDGLIANASPEELVAVCEEVKSRFAYDDEAGTFTVTLPQAWGPFLPIISRPWAYVIDKEWTIEQGDWDGSCDTWQNFYAPGAEDTKLARIINGTGPYVLDHWTPDEEWVLVARDDYWRGARRATSSGPVAPAACPRSSASCTKPCPSGAPVLPWLRQATPIGSLCLMPTGPRPTIGSGKDAMPPAGNAPPLTTPTSPSVCGICEPQRQH
jgi:peptide/nickel transport system substrate-binding protein